MKKIKLFFLDFAFYFLGLIVCALIFFDNEKMDKRAEKLINKLEIIDKKYIDILERSKYAKG